MKKDNGLLNALDDLMGDYTEKPEQQAIAPPIEPQKENLKQHNFRMKDTEWNRLKIHFQGKGLSIAAGLRMIILEYMKKEGV